MPDSFVGLLLFVVLLAPGFLYTWRSERTAPRSTPSPVRETASLVLVSVLCNAITLSLFALARAPAPGLTPDVGDFIRNGSVYFERHYREVALWSAILLGVSSAIALILPGLIALSRWWGKEEHERGDRGIADRTVWWESFKIDPRRREQVWLQCHLEDGTYLAGLLGPFTAGPREDVDRDLTLLAPIDCRAPGEDTPREINTTAVVSSRRILYLTVSYLPLNSTAALSTEDSSEQALSMRP